MNTAYIKAKKRVKQAIYKAFRAFHTLLKCNFSPSFKDVRQNYLTTLRIELFDILLCQVCNSINGTIIQYITYT